MTQISQSRSTSHAADKPSLPLISMLLRFMEEAAGQPKNKLQAME